MFHSFVYVSFRIRNLNQFLTNGLHRHSPFKGTINLCIRQQQQQQEKQLQS